MWSRREDVALLYSDIAGPVYTGRVRVGKAQSTRAGSVLLGYIMRLAGPVRIIVVLLTVGLTWILAGIMLGGQSGFPRLQQILGGPEVSSTADPRPRRFKCGLPQPCPDKHFAFRVVSGAANVIGPKICFEDRMLMSSVQNNVGRGLNIALVNDVSELLNFLRPIHEGTLVLLASYDDPATKMTEEGRKMFAELGSSVSKEVAFRDSWVLVGAKGVLDKTPFEQTYGM
ncbi:protein FAM3A-like isoform X3 [Pyxicephalus adspersus]|uniref:protein FAM3A-like isoform X3 n=1 Tax=Pyxicephalus adspersus TaxID=30357 RepID=UPI003B5C7D38